MWTTLAVYATIHALGVVVAVFTMLDLIKTGTELFVCASLNMIFWPLSLVLYLAKTLKS